MKETIDKLMENNTYEYNILKASEELQELALVLIQHILKPKKVKMEEITDEIGDVKIRMKVLECLFNKDIVDKRVEYKLGKFNEYLGEGKYKGGI
jgi:hypothetical protein